MWTPLLEAFRWLQTQLPSAHPWPPFRIFNDFKTIRWWSSAQGTKKLLPFSVQILWFIQSPFHFSSSSSLKFSFSEVPKPPPSICENFCLKTGAEHHPRNQAGMKIPEAEALMRNDSRSFPVPGWKKWECGINPTKIPGRWDTCPASSDHGQGYSLFLNLLLLSFNS